MTNAFDLLLAGELFRSLAQPFVDVSGELFFYFILLSMASLLVYFATKTIALTAMFFFIVSGALVTSHVALFSGGVVPGEFQGVMLLVAGVGVAGAILYLMKR